MKSLNIKIKKESDELIVYMARGEMTERNTKHISSIICHEDDLLLHIETSINLLLKEFE